jgi:hypothetical protein
MPSTNVKNRALYLEQDRIVILVEIRYTTTTKRYCNLEKTSVGDGSYYTWGNNNYLCIPLKYEIKGNQNIEGEFPTATLRISSINKENSDFVNVGDVSGKIVVITRTFEGLISASDYIDISKYKINKSGYDDETREVIYELTPIIAEFKNDVPLFIRDRNRCGFKFDADGTDPIAATTCGWWTQYAHRYYPDPSNPPYGVLTQAFDTANYQECNTTYPYTCDHSVRGKNGCAAHFNQTDKTYKPKLRGRFYPGMPQSPLRAIT